VSAEHLDHGLQIRLDDLVDRYRGRRCGAMSFPAVSEYELCVALDMRRLHE